MVQLSQQLLRATDHHQLYAAAGGMVHPSAAAPPACLHDQRSELLSNMSGVMACPRAGIWWQELGSCHALR